MAGEDGIIRGPAGDGRVSAVAQRDVAQMAAAILQDPAAHRDVSYDVTGPEALTIDEVAATIMRATGRPVSYERETVEEAYASRAHYGAPDWAVRGWVTSHQAVADGQLATVGDGIPRVLGRAATSLADLMRG